MPALTKDALLGRKPRIEVVDVPELGEGATLYVREMNAHGVLEYGVLHAELAGEGKQAVAATPALMGFLIERTVCDENGQRFFADGEFATAELPFAAAQRLWQKAMEVNQMTEVAASTSKKSSAEAPTSSLHAA